LICREAGDLAYPPLLKLKAPAEYRSIFETNYCREAITTFDSIEVRFRKRDFNHCFFESVKSKDDTFSFKRAERMLWIKAALQDKNAEMHVGWNNVKKKPAKNRRVAIVMGDYVVVIALKGQNKADFVTAFVANSTALRNIRTNPLWTQKNR